MDRIVTAIEGIDQRRSKIYIDCDEMFVLYKGEIRQYNIREKEEIPEQVYSLIQNEVLLKRAKKRCLNLLKARPYTEQKLREKLKEGFYPEVIIGEAIEYVKSYHYIDDYEYACQYITCHKETETKKKIEEKLIKRGITKEILERAIADFYYDEEESAKLEYEQAIKLVKKKKYNSEEADYKEKQKIYAYLIRKGIRPSVAKKVMVFKEDENFFDSDIL